MERNKISERILHIREIRGMSREQLADQVDLSVSFIYQIESGKKNVGLNALIRISEVLQVSLDVLVHGREEVPANQRYNQIFESIVSGCSQTEIEIVLDNAKDLIQNLRRHR